jgi:hypothetical protein
MSKSVRARNSLFVYLFSLSLLLTLTVYVLRGFQVLTFIPGGIIFILLAISIVTGLLYGLERMKRM